MAAKADYLEGVFVYTCSSPKKVYIGKSTGVGVAKRSTKSKLKKGVLHNIEMQNDYNNNPDNFDLVGETILLDGNKYGSATLSELIDEVRFDYIESGYKMYNDIKVVERTIDVEKDKYGLDEIGQQELSIVLDLVEFFKDNDVNVDMVRKTLSSAGIL